MRAVVESHDGPRERRQSAASIPASTSKPSSSKVIMKVRADTINHPAEQLVNVVCDVFKVAPAPTSTQPP